MLFCQIIIKIVCQQAFKNSNYDKNVYRKTYLGTWKICEI